MLELTPENIEYPITFCGLQKWYVSLFEKFGWMILAKRDKHNHKIENYKFAVLHLHEALVEKKENTYDIDTKNDLEILKYNIETLINHVKKEFGNLSDNKNIKMSSKHTKKNKK